MEHKEIEDVIEVLSDLKDDITVPKNVRSKIENTIKILDTDIDTQIKISKVLHELEDISNDTNLQQYTRTQIWNVVSVLEKIK
ncbi:MAG: UPF0147 family protein [Candidatus Woesearchaeota archaeon]|jgi:uncharacterized protein (UPF0147 family)|nr:UPF0147 family protein [Candidatus Woesearchaeota archaeon]MDP7622726.1 UPF0147 family protein [Candidatus Woesearchaeota archaeon]HJN57067.1 UPF0147 family protein [Candidatus Woesearchaeota archaeon]|tara:strand:- start:5611 stop:5859 length:249 start_codon:yes stop_codon:yes gene_type:complete